MRFAFIEAKKAKFGVAAWCRVLKVQRSGFYAWLNRAESKRASEDRLLSVEIRAAFEKSRKTYGSPRIRGELRTAGKTRCRHRIAKLMRQEGLQARPRRKFVVTTQSNHGLPTPPNHLERDFAAKRPNQIWAGDVTYLPTREGWLYLAVILDLHSRRVVGWALSERNDDALTLSALQIALDQRRPPRGLVHHSDRGATYASNAYQDALTREGIVCSMSRKGDCWDNAVVESFFSTLEFECARGEPFTSRAAARCAVIDYILGFYNPTRVHSYLGYRSPLEFERAV